MMKSTPLNCSVTTVRKAVTLTFLSLSVIQLVLVQFVVHASGCDADQSRSVRLVSPSEFQRTFEQRSFTELQGPRQVPPMSIKDAQKIRLAICALDPVNLGVLHTV
jgi:hypothetical protein